MAAKSRPTILDRRRSASGGTGGHDAAEDALPELIAEGQRRADVADLFKVSRVTLHRALAV
jgi:hypothetical protein